MAERAYEHQYETNEEGSHESICGAINHGNRRACEEYHQPATYEDVWSKITDGLIRVTIHINITHFCSVGHRRDGV
jgi:hypothetical protein